VIAAFALVAITNRYQPKAKPHLVYEKWGSFAIICSPL
jgi:hypothetical protein